MDPADLAFTPVVRQAELVRDREVSPRELVELYLRRIEQLDGRLNAFRAVYAERALSEAEQATARLRAGDARPLLGVPVAIKDNVDVAGDVTTHGTNAYGDPAREDCEVVRRVRAAGAIVIGRTNVPPLCAMPVTESSTWGITRNPWDPERTPGGSSGGSAAAVAAGLVGAALGSDGGGSIRLPAAFCGLFGLKPQRGRVSLAPVPEHWHGMSAVGWLARTVGDSALLYDVTMGATEIDRDRPPSPPRPFAEAAATAQKPLRIAYSLAMPPGVAGVAVDEEVRGAVLDTVELLRSLGHEVRERDPDYGPALLAATVRMARGVADEARSLPHFERLDLRFRNFTRFWSLVPDTMLTRAREAEEAHAARLNAVFDDHDVVITPVAPDLPVRAGRWEGHGWLWAMSAASRLVLFTPPWNHTGQPAAAVPAGWTAGGLPRSVQLVGRPNDEGTLLSLAAELERERPWADRRPPVS